MARLSGRVGLRGGGIGGGGARRGHAAVGAPGPGCAAPRASPPCRAGRRAVRAVAPATAVHGDVVLKPRDPPRSTPSTPRCRRRARRPSATTSPRATFASTVRARIPSTISSVRAWLAGRGPRRRPHVARRPHRPVSGTATQVDEAFDVGPRAVPPALGPGACASPTPSRWCPSALAGDLYGVTGLDDLSRPDTPAGPTARLDAGREHGTERRAPPATADAGAGAVAPRPGAHSHRRGVRTPSSPTARERRRAHRRPSWHRRTRSRASTPGNEGSGVTVGIYELEPFLTVRHQRLQELLRAGHHRRR